MVHATRQKPGRSLFLIGKTIMSEPAALSGFADYLASFQEDPRYLNFASLGPVSRPVVEKGERLLRAMATGERQVEALLAAQEPRAIDLVSRLSGFASQNITLISNTSSALVQIAMGLPSGSRVIADGYQFPANVWPWRNARAMGRVKTRFIGALDQPITPDLICASLQDEDDVVAISAVDFRTGYLADLVDMRAAIGDRLLIVDAIQAFGAIVQDWTLADVVIAGGQKWMRAGQGTGFMALSERAIERIAPLAGNWAGIEDSLDIKKPCHQPQPGAARFETTRCSPVLAGCFAQAL